MKKYVYGITIGSLALTFIFFGMFVSTKNDICLSLGITMMALCFHFSVRLVVKSLCDYRIKPDTLEPSERRFREKPMERKLYARLKIRYWKDKFPSWDPEGYSLRTHSVDELIFATCKTEVTHRYSALFGFASMLFCIPLGGVSIVLTMSILAALFDLSFVAAARFNRPRLRKIADSGKYN